MIMNIIRQSKISKNPLYLHNQIDDEEFAKNIQDHLYMFHNVKKFSKKSQQLYKYIDHNGDEQDIQGFHHLILYPKKNLVLVFIWDLRVVVGYIENVNPKHLLAKNYDPRTPLVCMEPNIITKLTTL